MLRCTSVPPIWADLFHNLIYSEPNNLFNRDIQKMVFKKLLEMYNSKKEKFINGVACGLEYWFQRIRSYLELADVIREVEPIDQIPEIKTRLYRIPVYAQILESILSNLFKFLTCVIGSTSGVDYSNQKSLGNLKNILESNGFGDLLHFVDIDIRNAINHGGIINSQWDVKFIYTFGKDRIKQEKEWAVVNIFEETARALLGVRKPHFDDFIEGAFDDAGGIIVGVLRLFCLYPEIIIRNINYISGNEYLLSEYLCRFLSYPGCTCTHIDIALTGSPQLNIHFITTESNHGELARHAFETAIIMSNWVPNFQRYSVSYRHLRMPSGIIIFTKDELNKMATNQIMPVEVKENIISRGDFRLFNASDEDIDLETIKRFRYPLINGDQWMLREIEDCSLENNKRFRANLYIKNADSKDNVINAISSAIERLKNTENPPSPFFRIKHGQIVSDAVYLHVYNKRLRRKDKSISPNNYNFICMAEWHSENCPPLKYGGIPKNIWDKLNIEIYNDLLISWNPNFIS